MIAFERGGLRRIVLVVCGFVLAGPFSGCAFGPRLLEKTHGRTRSRSGRSMKSNC